MTFDKMLIAIVFKVCHYEGLQSGTITFLFQRTCLIPFALYLIVRVRLFISPGPLVQGLSIFLTNDSQPTLILIVKDDEYEKMHKKFCTQCARTLTWCFADVIDRYIVHSHLTRSLVM